ncbi:hypothetical protein ACFYVL_27760 [Streptomyces sp. NPDC004111]|uniref:hypothetical protein n=1 Tax=Streptomyces sp. NPDC004111 TaxID=3364690 RepID=UPI0036A3CD0F
MLLKNVEPDMRVAVTTRRGTAAGTVLEITPPSDSAPARVRVAYDRGGEWQDVSARALSLLDPEQDTRDPNTLPRTWRWDMGWLFWRGGQAYLAYCLDRAWCVMEWFDGPGSGRVTSGHRTREAAIAEAVEKIDARAAMTFHKSTMPSMRDGEPPAGLKREGWEVWPSATRVNRREVAHHGELKGWIELRHSGWAMVVLNADDEEFELCTGLPHPERAAMLLRAEFPFADDE